MAKTRGTGLPMVWTASRPSTRPSSTAGTTMSTCRGMLEVPGFLSAGRYGGAEGRPEIPRYLRARRSYVFRSAADLDTVKCPPSAQRQENRDEPGRAQFSAQRLPPNFPDAHPPNRADRGHGAGIADGRIDVSSAVEEEFNAWYNTLCIPGYLTVPGCIRRSAQRRRRRPAEIPHTLPIRARPGAGERSLEPDPRDQQPVDPADAGPICATTKARPASTGEFIRNSRAANEKE